MFSPEVSMSEPQKYPAGWDEKRVKDLIAHYEGQTEDEQADEIEAALRTTASQWSPSRRNWPTQYGR